MGFHKIKSVFRYLGITEDVIVIIYIRKLRKDLFFKIAPVYNGSKNV